MPPKPSVRPRAASSWKSFQSLLSPDAKANPAEESVGRNGSP
jgi:hypothetical protein